ncbi:MAG: sigma-54-dependent Fis family transcriptional regulator, partial [Planctomycetes bacterium]|nr:sigma-54-dependent Fis family transcriptional regulator [Planctomycetota bacterium]
KGAFSGAIDNHDGLFARCSPYGSIFLDEIGDVSIPIQIMLLKILQERTFSPVGSHEQCRFSGRVIAATNKPIDELREKGVFRDDFFYRLCSDIIYVPPLRQRLREDPHELIDMLSHIVSRIIGQPSPDLVEMVIEVVRKDIGLDYNWPGNVREMEQAVRRILLTRHYRLETGSKKSDLRSRLVAAVDDGSVTAQDLLAGYCQLMYEKFGTYEEVARRLNLDRRTVKKYVQSEENQD